MKEALTMDRGIKQERGSSQESWLCPVAASMVYWSFIPTGETWEMFILRGEHMPQNYPVRGARILVPWPLVERGWVGEC